MAKRKPFHERSYVDHLTYGMLDSFDDLYGEELETVEAIWADAIVSQIPEWVPKPSSECDGFHKQVMEMLQYCFDDKESARVYMRLARKENVKEQVRDYLEEIGKLESED